MATGGPRSFTSTPLRLRDGHCVSELRDTLLLVHRTSSRSGRCSRTARTGGRATVTCAVGWRCVGSEHRVPGFGRAGVHAKLNVLSRFHVHQSWNYTLVRVRELLIPLGGFVAQGAPDRLGLNVELTSP